MSRRSMNADDILNGFPRVSGDEPPVGVLDEGLLEFSPRERG